jgi:hypothetical protein
VPEKLAAQYFAAARPNTGSNSIGRILSREKSNKGETHACKESHQEGCQESHQENGEEEVVSSFLHGKNNGLRIAEAFLLEQVAISIQQLGRNGWTEH